MKKNSTARRTLHYYWQEVKKYKWYSLGVMILSPIVIFVRDIFGVYVFADILEKIMEGIPSDQIIPVLLPEALAYLGLFILDSLVLEKLRMVCCWKSEILAMYDLDCLVFDTICAQSMQFHNDRFSGSLVSQTNKFVGAFELLADTMIWDFIPLVTYIIVISAILFVRVPIFAAILLAVIVGYTIITAVTFKKLGDCSEAEAKAQTKKTGQLSDSISNIISVKSYAKEKYEQGRYAKFQKKHRDASFNTMRTYLKRDLAFSGVIVLLTAALLFFILTGTTWFGLSVSTLILVINYSRTILSNLYDITHIFKNINRGLGDAREMTNILDMVDDVVDEPNAQKLNISRGAVKFDHVDFKHRDAKNTIFNDFSLDIKPGERIGLVGISGSGKTTLTKLLLRFADVDAGEIAIDGQNIKNVTQQSLRESIAYVPQETALFHRSITENIAYSKPDAEWAEIERAAKLANVDHFVEELPEGYDTLVGERGVKLSGGQRQRIAIARALLKDAPILVLDEATSALDSESEALIQEALTNLMKGRTAIVVAHRLSTIANLDRIVVLGDGKILEQGTHQELLVKNGAYKKLWARQSGAFLKSED